MYIGVLLVCVDLDARGCGTPGSITDHREPLCGWWELNLRPLEQLLTSELSLQPTDAILPILNSHIPM